MVHNLENYPLINSSLRCTRGGGGGWGSNVIRAGVLVVSFTG